jgi:branched-chain amino acid transport system ATP-binding protein
MSAMQLSTDRLSVAYGGVHAVVDVNLRVGAGAIVGLIGPNGAGKTSAIDALSGFTPASGTITFDGADISTLPPHRRVQLGLVRTWQSVELFDDLTVRDNLSVASEPQGIRVFLRDLIRPPKDQAPQVDAALQAVGLPHIADELPTSLSQGDRKLVGVARALAASPKLLLLDEPAAGLDRDRSIEFGHHLRDLARGGLSMLLVDHNTQLVLDVCDYIYVLDFGSIIAEGNPSEIRSNRRVVEAYLGEGHAAATSVPGSSEHSL